MVEREEQKKNFVIRRFLPEDQIATRWLILQGLGEHFGYIDETLNPDLNDIEAYYLRPGHVFVVVEHYREVVGTGALLLESADTGRLVRMSVKKKFRRQGVGRAVVCHFLQLAKRRGLIQVLVETNHDWYDAIGLYHSQGFREYDRDDESVHMSLRIR